MTNIQPIGDLRVYDLNVPRHATDTSTSARTAAVAFEHTIRSDTVENGAFFKSDGTMFLQRKGTSNRLSFTRGELISAKNCLFTHNHPGGLSFSRADVRNAIEYDLGEIRAVSAYWRHIMRPITHWPSLADLALHEPIGLQRATANVQGMINNGQLSNQFLGLEVQHQQWVLLSRQLNFEYRREAS